MWKQPDYKHIKMLNIWIILFSTDYEDHHQVVFMTAYVITELSKWTNFLHLERVFFFKFVDLHFMSRGALLAVRHIQILPMNQCA
jgi:hypothetical protein